MWLQFTCCKTELHHQSNALGGRAERFELTPAPYEKAQTSEEKIYMQAERSDITLRCLRFSAGPKCKLKAVGSSKEYILVM